MANVELINKKKRKKILPLKMAEKKPSQCLKKRQEKTQQKQKSCELFLKSTLKNLALWKQNIKNAT